LLNDQDVRRYSPPPPASDAGFARFVAWSCEQRSAGRYACFAIEPRPDAPPAGLIQLRALEPTFRSAEWGFALGRPFWGTGLFGAAADLVLDFAFGTIGVERLEARSVVANRPALAALRKLGAVLEGTLRQSFLLGGEYHDDALLTMLEDDWHRRRGMGAQAAS
jgi:RimJ/RimL family protein N-acetyltransferase